MGAHRMGERGGQDHAEARPRFIPRLAPATIFALLAIVGLAGAASAHAAGSAHPDDWKRLVTIILGMATVVAAVV